MSVELAWLPELPRWSELLDAARQQPVDEAFASVQQLATGRMDSVRGFAIKGEEI